MFAIIYLSYVSARSWIFDGDGKHVNSMVRLHTKFVIWNVFKEDINNENKSTTTIEYISPASGSNATALKLHMQRLKKKKYMNI